MPMKAPCRGCDKRHPSCHADCEAYLSYRNEREEIREKRNKHVETTHFLITNASKAARRKNRK